MTATLPDARPIPVPAPPARPRRRAAGVSYAELGANPAPPIKPPTWKWYIPIYFWTGGIASGAWLAATAEDVAGPGDRAIVRAGRYLAAGGIAAGTALLVLDLGRPERFLNMLRIFRARSAMSLGSWGLTLFGACTAAGAVLQAAEDGVPGLGGLARLSRGRAGRALHLIGLPAGLFTGGYTGVLLASTTIPQWARRSTLLGPLFLAAGVSSGLAAVSLHLQLVDGTPPPARLRRAEAAALGLELALALRSEADARHLPSGQGRSRTLRAALLGAGMALPLAMHVVRRAGRRRRRRRRTESELLAAGLALAGSLGLRYLTTREGYRSAALPADTWRFAEHAMPRHSEGAR